MWVGCECARRNDYIFVQSFFFFFSPACSPARADELRTRAVPHQTTHCCNEARPGTWDNCIRRGGPDSPGRGDPIQQKRHGTRRRG
jgi:hypothetical protein